MRVGALAGRAGLMGRCAPESQPDCFANDSEDGPVGQVGLNPRGVSEIRREIPLSRSNEWRLRR